MTYNESTTLFLVGAGKPRHGVQDLDARVVIDKDGIVIVLTVTKDASVNEAKHVCMGRTQWKERQDWGLGDWSGRSDESDSDSNAGSTGTCASPTLLALHDASRRGVLGLSLNSLSVPGRSF